MNSINHNGAHICECFRRSAFPVIRISYIILPYSIVNHVNFVAVVFPAGIAYEASIPFIPKIPGTVIRRFDVGKLKVATNPLIDRC